MIKRLLYLLLIAVPVIASGQSLKKSTDGGGGLGHGDVFSPFKDNPKDSTKKGLIVPKEIHQWKVDRRFGNKMEINADTLQFMFQTPVLAS